MFGSRDSTNFTLSGGGTDFANRQKDLFEKLKEAELGTRTSQQDVNMDYHPIQSEEMEMDFNASRQLKRKRRSETKHLRGKESIFKRPEVPPPWRGKNIPDHKKNPHKWTRYSLGDVSQDDMSERTNTSTALSFLNDLRKRKEMDTMDIDDNSQISLQSQVVFKRPSNSRRTVPESQEKTSDRLESNKPVFRGSKRVMPEYIVGQGSKKSSKKKEDKLAQNKNEPSGLKLDHLFEPEVDSD